VALFSETHLKLQERLFIHSASQCPTHDIPEGSDDILDIVVHQNVQLSDIIVSDVLDSDHLPIVFHILDHVSAGSLQPLLINSQTGSGFEA
jgi:hypothetical protein